MPNRKNACVSILDCSLSFRENIKKSLLEYNHDVISEFDNSYSFIQSLNLSKKPDIALISIDIEPINGIELTQKIKSICPELKVVILTENMKADLFSASMFSGANAFVLKNTDIKKLVNILRAVSIGAYWFEPNLTQSYCFSFPKPKSYDLLNLYDNKTNEFELTRREKEVLNLLVAGKTNTEIAKEMYVSINTAKAHVGNILTKMHVTDRVQAAVKAVKSNLI